MPQLFSYGTLQQDNVQIETFGRLLKGEKATLLAYELGEIRITDEAVLAASGKEFHPILIYTGNDADHVEGTVFEITDKELANADDYEVDDYQRVSAFLASGKQAWIYSAADSV